MVSEEETMAVLTHIDLNMIRLSEAGKHCPECGYYVMWESHYGERLLRLECPNCRHIETRHV